MSKKLKIFLFAFIAMFSSVNFYGINYEAAYAETAQPKNDFEYSINIKDEVVITKYIGKESEVTIPSVIDNKSVKTISDSAFENCSELKSVILPSSIETIGNRAFADCASLSSIVIPCGVQSIGTSAFLRCNSLKSVQIPSSVTEIGDVAFSRCSSLTSIDVDDNNVRYSSKDGALYDMQNKKLINAPGTIENLEIPDGINIISQFAFSDLKNLKTVILPESVNKIESYAFCDDDNLQNIVILNKDACIDENAISRCNNLKNIYAYKNDYFKGNYYSSYLKQLEEDINDGYIMKSDCNNYTDKDVTIKEINGKQFRVISKLQAFDKYSTSYTTTENGSFVVMFTEKDKYYVKNININNIDKDEPAIDANVNTSELTNEDVEIDITAMDSNVDYIQMPDGNKITDKNAKYMAKSNGDYTFIVYDKCKRKAEKTITIDNIDKDNPTIIVNATKKQLTNKGVQINVTGEDDNFSYIEMPDGSKVAEKSSSYIAIKNGAYTFKVYDKAGNFVKKTLSINNIDRVGPTASYTLSEENLTDKDITVSVSSDDQDFAYMILPDGTKVTSNKAVFTASKNGNYIINAYDKLGNKKVNTIAITNIDKDAPEITIGTYDVRLTNKGVMINIMALDDNLSYIEMPDGSKVTENKKDYYIKENGNYTIKAYDKLGHVAIQNYTVNNIDKKGPDINLSLSTEDFTENNVIITTDVEDEDFDYMNLPDGKSVSDRINSYTVSTNGTYKFEAFDKLGNSTIKTINITNIDKDVPVLDISANTTELTNKDVEINIIVLDSNFSYIEMPDGSKVIQNNAKLDVKENGQYKFLAYDKLGNKTEKIINVNNIDKTGVSLNASLSEENLTSKDVVITISTDDEDFAYMILPDENKITEKNGVFIAAQNGVYTIKAYDKLGNETIKTIDIINIGFDVCFKDYDGHMLNSQIVLPENDAKRPQDPTREGYTFKGWDKEFSNVTNNLEINAVYEINKYKIIVNGVEQSVEYGKDVVLPIKNPIKEGYIFKGWEGQITDIKSDGVVNPIFEKDKEEEASSDDNNSGDNLSEDNNNSDKPVVNKPSTGTPSEDETDNKPSAGTPSKDESENKPPTGTPSEGESDNKPADDMQSTDAPSKDKPVSKPLAGSSNSGQCTSPLLVAIIGALSVIGIKRGN